VLRRLSPSHSRALAITGCALALAVLSLWLLWPGSRSGAWLTRVSYDWSEALAVGEALTNSPVVIVYLDLASHEAENQNPLQPWDRALHARLLQRLTRAGAKAVVFDIIFDTSGRNPDADTALAEAMRANGNVVLAGELSASGRSAVKTAGEESQTVIRPAKLFRDAAAAWGLANAQTDEDYVVRRLFRGFSAGEPSLVIAAGRLVRASNLERRRDWVKYYGPPLTIPYVSYSAALRADETPDAFFHDKIVFVGARPMAGVFGERKDEFRSPLASWGSRNLFMPAVEVHATQLVNLLRGDSLGRFSPTVEALIVILTAFLCCALFFAVRPLAAAGIAVVSELAALASVSFLLPPSHLWFPWLIPCAFEIPLALFAAVLWRTLEWVRDKRRFQARIREQSALIEKAQDAIITLDLRGHVTYANPSAVRLYGWIGRQDSFLTDAPADLAPAASRQAVLAAGEWIGELAQKSAHGRDLIVASRWTLIRDAAGAPHSILLINTDITEKKRLEEDFLRAQRLESVGALAAGMAHDLNNALAPVLMGVQLLRKNSQDEEIGRMLAVMEANTHRGADMVRQVLLFSRGQDAGREPLALGALLRDMERVARQTFPKSINVATLAPPDLWPVLGNATQLHQALLNLCVNARDAMPNGGQLTLAADNVALTAQEAAGITGAAPGSFVMIVVSDTGCGISAEALPRVFEPFFTTKPVGQGTGLGLSTTARIVHQHGGFVQVKSELHQGTTFELYLPCATICATPEDQRPSPPPPRGSGQLILVADDEESAREMISLALKTHGYEVFTAANGAEALALFEQRQKDIALTLIDSDMPALSGEQTIPLLRARDPGAAIVLMTGNTNVLAPAGIVLLAKPFPVHELLTAVAARLPKAG